MAYLGGTLKVKQKFFAGVWLGLFCGSFLKMSLSLLFILVTLYKVLSFHGLLEKRFSFVSIISLKPSRVGRLCCLVFLGEGLFASLPLVSLYIFCDFFFLIKTKTKKSNNNNKERSYK